MRFGVFVAAAAGMLCAAAPAAAATSYQSFSGYGSYGGGLGAFFNTIYQFDPRLGALDAVTVSYNVQAVLFGSASAFGPNNQPATAQFTPVVLNPAGLNFGSLSTPATLTPTTGTISVTGRQEVSFDFAGSGSRTFTAGLGSFIGTGIVGPTSWDWPYTNVTVNPGSAQSAYFAAQDSGGAIQYTVTYAYTAAAAAVPEMATWGMMIVGMGAIGAALRRRRPALAMA